MAMFNFKHSILLPITTLDHFFNSEKSPKDENNRSVFNETLDLERVMKDKAILEEESRRLDEAQERLHLQARMLCGKIMIQEMKKRNGEKRQALDQLQEKVSSLEAQLSPPSMLNTSEY